MKSSHVKVKDHVSLVKDMRSMAVLSNDDSAYLAAKQSKKQRSELNEMKNDIAELKDMFTLLLNKLDK